MATRRMHQPGGDNTPIIRTTAHRRFDDDPVQEAATHPHIYDTRGLGRQTSRVTGVPEDPTSSTPNGRPDLAVPGPFVPGRRNRHHQPIRRGAS